MSEFIFIESTEDDPASTLMLAVAQKREEGYALHGGLVPAVNGLLREKIGQWMELTWPANGPGAEYKLVRAPTAHILQEAVSALVVEGWELHAGTVFYHGKYLQWVKRTATRREAWKPEVAALSLPVLAEPVYSIDA